MEEVKNYYAGTHFISMQEDRGRQGKTVTGIKNNIHNYCRAIPKIMFVLQDDETTELVHTIKLACA